jgi:tetrahydromethanopterin S-methyltransferase subunit G
VLAMLYFSHMEDTDFEQRFDRIDKKLQAGFAQVTGLIDSLASLCAREFAAISEHFNLVDKRLDDIEAKIEVFGRRMDDEAAQRHKLAERVSNLGRSV